MRILLVTVSASFFYGVMVFKSFLRNLPLRIKATANDHEGFTIENTQARRGVLSG